MSMAAGGRTEPLANPTRGQHEVLVVRRGLSLLVAVILLAALAGPASAGATPVEDRRVRTDIPLGTYDIELPPEEGCADFAVLVEDIDGRITEVFITEDRHGNVLTRTIFHTITRYTNLETGKSFERRFDSVGNYTFKADGTVRIIGRNDTLIWGPEPPGLGLGEGIWLVDAGRVVLEYDETFTFVSGQILWGEAIDVCAALR
jgi:hypothetical protein